MGRDRMAKKKASKKVQVCVVAPFDIQVAVWRTREKMIEYYAEVLSYDVEPTSNVGPSNGLCYAFKDDSGVNWYNLILPESVKPKTIVHECSHAIDFIMDDVGVPIGIENTEIRAYLLGDLYEDVCIALENADA